MLPILVYFALSTYNLNSLSVLYAFMNVPVVITLETNNKLSIMIKLEFI